VRLQLSTRSLTVAVRQARPRRRSRPGSTRPSDSPVQL